MKGMSHEKRVALYLRVSTKGRSVENQRPELEVVAAQRGWAVVAAYQGAGVNGARGPTSDRGSTGFLGRQDGSWI